MPTPVQIGLILLTDHSWLPPADVILGRDDYFYCLSGRSLGEHTGRLLDYYLGKEQFRCCDMQVGMAVEVDGAAWNGGTTDHFWHLGGWFYGLKTILAGGENSRVTTFVWDESSLVMERQGEQVRMYDGFPEYGRYTSPPVTVPLRLLAAELVREGEVCLALMDGLLAEIEARGYSREQLLPLLGGKGDMPIAGREEIPLRLAIMVRELSQPAFAADVEECGRLLSELLANSN